LAQATEDISDDERPSKKPKATLKIDPDKKKKRVMAQAVSQPCLKLPIDVTRQLATNMLNRAATKKTQLNEWKN